MKPDRKTLLFGIVAILLLDIIGSIASNKIGFNYAYLSLFSFLIYGIMGFKITQIRNLRTGVLFAAITGLVDASAGWAISTALGANTGQVIYKITPVLWLITAIMATGMAAIAGLIGGAFANVKKGRN